MTPSECRLVANAVIDAYLERTGATTTEEVACNLGILVSNAEVTMHFICGADFTERAMAAAKVAASMQIRPNGMTAMLFRANIRQGAAGTPPANDPKAPT